MKLRSAPQHLDGTTVRRRRRLDGPLLASAWASPERVVTATAMLGLFVATTWLGRAWSPFGAVFLASSTLALRRMLLVVRRTSRVSLTVRSAITTWMIAVPLMTLAAWAFWGRFDSGGLIVGLFLVPVLAYTVGGLFGLVFGAVLLPLMAALLRATTQPSHGGHDRLLLRCGAWLLAAATLGLVLPPALGTPWMVVPLTAAGAGLAFAFLGSLRMIARCRWLARVRAGQITAYGVLPLEHLHLLVPAGDARSGHHELLPLEPVAADTNAAALDGVLVLRGAATGGPYRAAPCDVPIALVPLLSDVAPSSFPSLTWRDFRRQATTALLALVAVGLSFVISLTIAILLRGRFTEDLGVPMYVNGPDAQISALFAFLFCGIALLAVSARLRRSATPWYAGLPLIPAGLIGLRLIFLASGMG